MAQRRALIVGGGIGGMSAAISLAELGLDIELIDVDPEWKVYGAGITITGPTLRAFKALGLLPQIMAKAYTGEGIQVCSADGVPLAVLPTPVRAEDGVPGCGGIMRPLLHQILSTRVRALDVRVGLGLSVDSYRDEPDRIVVRFTDGSEREFDFVVGADGLFSRMRKLAFPASPVPTYTGQNAWRLRLARPAAIERRHFFLGGRFKVGLTPVSADEMYMFLLQNARERIRVPQDQLHFELRALLEGYGGILREIARGLSPASQIVLRPLEAFLLPGPWHAGRVLLIGDAAHPTTPQLASGAGLAVEDALVLRECLAQDDGIPAAFERFMARRYDRCRLVVENSLEIGRREQAGRPIEEQTRIVEDSLRLLAEPI